MFLPPPFVFHVGPSCGFKGSGDLVDLRRQFMGLVACVVH